MTSPARPYAEVIGDPVDHSLSPLIHGFWLEQLEIEADYRRHRVRRGELAVYLAERREDADWRGCNVTMPLKLDALALADEASDRALGTGAANILIPRDGRLVAGNTDVSGLVALFERLRQGGASMGAITLLGSGGAARAALMALHLLGIVSVRIQSRNDAEAYKLAVQFKLTEEPVPMHSAVGGDGLINATPLGMPGAPPFQINIGGLAAKGWVIDFVTSPRPTELIRQVSERGLTVVDGIELLVEQAADSFALFFGQDPPRDRDPEVFARLRS